MSVSLDRMLMGRGKNMNDTLLSLEVLSPVNVHGKDYAVGEVVKVTKDEAKHILAIHKKGVFRIKAT